MKKQQKELQEDSLFVGSPEAVEKTKQAIMDKYGPKPDSRIAQLDPSSISYEWASETLEENPQLSLESLVAQAEAAGCDIDLLPPKT